MHYQLNEGTFTLFPAAWQDTTINVLRDEASGLSLVVSRGTLAEGCDFEQTFHRQWETLRPQLAQIEQGAFTRVMAGVDNTLRAVEVETAFTRNGQQLWQKQLAIASSTGLLLFTLSSLHPFNEEDHARWQQFRQSMTLNNNQDG